MHYTTGRILLAILTLLHILNASDIVNCKLLKLLTFNPYIFMLYHFISLHLFSEPSLAFSSQVKRFCPFALIMCIWILYFVYMQHERACTSACATGDVSSFSSTGSFPQDGRLHAGVCCQPAMTKTSSQPATCPCGLVPLHTHSLVCRKARFPV